MNGSTPGLRYVEPYFVRNEITAKGRWLKRELIDVLSSELKGRTPEYWRYSIEAGLTTVNGEAVSPQYKIKNSDVISNVVHKHEPPCSDQPIKVVYECSDFIVVDKPSSLAVHPTGPWVKNSVTWRLENEFGYEKVLNVNRLDRLTSGLLILCLNKATAVSLMNQFVDGTVEKEYLAKTVGHFPDGVITCDRPILVLPQSLKGQDAVVSDEGKSALTIFKRVSYDSQRDQSVVSCFPKTGRTHQIRCHLNFLGFPIANDPIYIPQYHSVLGRSLATSEDEPVGLLNKARSVQAQDRLEELSSNIEGWADWEDVVRYTLEKVSRDEDTSSVGTPISLPPTPPPLYCPECYRPEPFTAPNLESLLIYLHAQKYKTTLGEFQTEVPFWAKEDWDGKLPLQS